MPDVVDKIYGIDGAARAVMEQLFLNGPTWDGDIVSKVGRGTLFEKGYADRYQGWSFLTVEGMTFAIDRMVLHGRKEARDRRRRA